MDKWAHSTLYIGYYYLSIMEFKLIPVSKRGPGGSLIHLLKIAQKRVMCVIIHFHTVIDNMQNTNSFTCNLSLPLIINTGRLFKRSTKPDIYTNNLQNPHTNCVRADTLSVVFLIISACLMTKVRFFFNDEHHLDRNPCELLTILARI